MVPDFKVKRGQLPGWCEEVLAELKVVSCCPSHYKPGGDPEAAKAVRARARSLAAEYKRKARKADQGFCGVPEGVKGRVESRLEGFGVLQG